MNLILFRHGIAQDISSDGSDDARQLTDEGHQRTAEVAQGLFKLIGNPEVIVVSPKIRTKQTATIFANIAGHGDLQIEPVIAGPSTHDIKSFILKQSCSSLLLVGHEPTLSELAESLCTGQTSTGLFQMKKAGAIGIDLPAAYRKASIPGSLQWVLPPAMLCEIAKR